jgi:cold shock CspA family protein
MQPLASRRPTKTRGRGSRLQTREAVEEGDRVEFEVETSPKGPRAKTVKVL